MTDTHRNESLAKMVLSLGIITIAAGALLAGVYTMTTGKIRAAQAEAQVAAIKAVTPPFDNNPVSDRVEITPPGENLPVVLFPVSRDGVFRGAAVETYSSLGFNGDIRLMVGFDDSGNITGYEVMSQAETPGLGAKMGDWFRDTKGNRSVIGRNPAVDDMRVAKDGGQIDGITAATITSRAFLDAVNRACKTLKIYRNEEVGNADAATGATSQKQ